MSPSSLASIAFVMTGVLARLSISLSKHWDLVPNCYLLAVVHSQQASHLDIQIPIVRGEAPLKPHRIFSSKGEKKMKDQSNRTHLIKAYLNDSEYERFCRMAEATKNTNSNLVRRLLQTSVFVEFPPVEYRGIIDQLEHIGINLYQFARVAHSLGFIDEPQYPSMMVRGIREQKYLYKYLPTQISPHS